MSLVLAAAGRGSRLGHLTAHIPKPLVAEPLSGRPILSLLLERISVHENPEHIVIIGSHDTSRNNLMLRCVQEFPFSKTPQVHLLETERQGVGVAFMRGIEFLLKLGVHNAVCSVADSVAANYGALFSTESPVTIGVTAPDLSNKKVFTSINVTADGCVEPEESAHPIQQQRIVRGIYRFGAEALSEYVDIARHGLATRTLDPRVMNNAGEMRVTWIWREMQESGVPIRAADLLEVAELNTPEDLWRFGKLSLYSEK